jgi:hypothetical protein
MYLDENLDRCVPLADLRPADQQAYARQILEGGRPVALWENLYCKVVASREEAQAVIAQAEGEEAEKQVGVSALKKPGGKLARRKARREAWRQTWLPKLEAVRSFIHRQDKYGWRYPTSCRELAAHLGIAPYTASRLAHRAIKAGLIAKEGRLYAPKNGRPPVL